MSEIEKETQELNNLAAKMNVKLLEKNDSILSDNQAMAQEEHAAKMQIFHLQRDRMLAEDQKEVEPAALSSVEQFHKLFGHPVAPEPKIPNEGRCDLRIALIQEELDEFSKALDEGDLVEAADALADMQYVLSGAVLELGLKDKFKAIFDEVQRSNMSKACTTEHEAQDTVDHYKINKNTDAYFKKVDDGTFLVYRKDDNKVLKSINYSPADLKSLI